jgi:NADH:ubiquinone oxidoreductase subunit 5 (subunit L)/multisubunit Na+/H+ antiporter MnhA subunit
MKMKHRSPIAVFFFSIITLGIYDLYWLVKTKKVLNKNTKYHVPSIWLLIAPWILLIACYIGFFASATHSTTNQSNTTYSYGVATQTTSNTKITDRGEFFASLAGLFIGWIAFLFISVFWFFRFSKAVNQYTKGKMSTAVTFLILWLIHLIGVALVQDAFNEM